MNPIVGIGELLWDVFPDGRKVAGGAPFNFAFHCQQLGHEAVIVSRVGDDDLGRELRAEVKRLGLSDAFIQADRDHPTGTVQVSVDAQGQPTYTIAETVAWDFIACLPQVNQLVQTASAVCFGTLAQRTPNGQNGVHDILRHVRKGLRVFDVNVRQHYYSLGVISTSLHQCDWVKLSDEDLVPLAGLLDLDLQDSVTQFRQLCRKYPDAPFHIAVLTRGEHGCLTYQIDSRPRGEWHPGSWVRRWGMVEEVFEPSVPARVVDTVGAGDAFTAAMLCLHLEGRPLRECARFANHYAARVCEHQGGTPRIDRAEVERAAFG